ncbi:MAG: 3'-5' exonuclease, partial [Bacteroidales bacterium]|nr:3'-5' exonuclease [Bacteroidales bacterium]
IDSFLQKVMRNLAKELGIGSNYNLIIDDSDIIKETIERVISSTDKDKALYDWYMDMIDSRVEEGKRVNVEKELIDFSRNLDKEVFKRFESEIKTLDKEVLSQFKQKGNGKLIEIKKSLIAYGDRFAKIFEENGLIVDNFAGKSRGIANALLGIRKENFDFRDKTYYQKAIDGIDGWFSDSVNRSSKADLVNNTLIPLLNEYFEYFDTCNQELRTWQAVLPFIDNIGLLKNIANHRDNILKEENKFLLSNTSKLLSDIIRLDNNSDISFIYEKIGSKIKYIMIDEFQDTSLLNWKTLSPLVLESLDRGQRNVIVGDVKQSIYRWRNGDWRILNNIDKGISYEESSSNPRIPNIETLKTNYRTDKNIVEFNNNLFSQGLYLLCENIEELDKERINQIKGVFSDASQETKPNSPQSGNIRVELLVGKRGSFEERTLNTLKQEIDYHLEKGYSPKDIAILLRTNAQVSLVADYLSGQNYSIVSDMAFSYMYSQSIRLIIDALKYVNNKENTVSLFNLKRYIYKDDKALQDINLSLKIPQELEWITKKEILRKPLFDLTVHIIKQLQIDKDEKELSFITSFLDQVQEYTKNNSSNLSTFLTYWEEDLQTKKIIINDDYEGIRLLSIHKSKGLEFPVVIIPYANWKFSSETELWLNENKLDSTIPTLLSKNNSLNNSFYHQEYLDEQLQQYVDNLNLLYVALTRPKHSLSIIGQLNQNKDGIDLKHIDNISKFLYIALNKQLKEETNQEGEMEYNYCIESEEQTETTTKQLNTSTTEQTNIFKITPNSIPLQSSFLDSQIKYSQTRQAKEFISALKNDEKEESSPRQKGIILHNLLSKINTKQDIEKTIETSAQKGEIVKPEKDYYKSIVEQMLSTEQASVWFSSEYKILNEIDIIIKEEAQITTKRPDRLMITKDNDIILVDYKFAKTKKNINQYSSQIKTYEQLIKQIGFNKIQSYL